MRKLSKSIFFGAVVILACAVGWWLLGRSRPTDSPKVNEKVSKAQNQTRALSDGLPEVVQPFARTPFLGLKDPRWIERRRLRGEDPAYQWRTPIEFYGKVIDEKGQPVAGASIEVAWNGTVEKYGGDGVGKRTLTSDASGAFSLKGVEGKGMSVYVSKEGYYRRSKPNGWFEYAGFWEPTFIEPDRNNPIVFHLVKRPVAEPTYRVGGRIFLQPPALETHLDLLSPNGQVAAPADLYVRITRPADASYEKPFNWSLAIEGRNGAEIIETTDEFMLRAPADGYALKLAKHYQNPTGNARQKLRFYVRSKARKLYAAVDFEIAAYRRMSGSEPASIIISATVNPNDSPNVEYDPKMNIREMARRR